MSLTSFAFIGFLLICGVIYYLVPKRAQWIVLLLASLVFYVLSSSVLIVFLLLSTLLIYFGALKIQSFNDDFKAKKAELDKSERKLLKAKTKKNKKIVLTVIVILNIVILAVLKYCNFFGEILNGAGALFGSSGIVPVFDLILPLGISYYTLMSISYIVDVYRGSAKAEKNPFRLLLFVSYFPHIMEGPFDRYSDLDKQFREPHYFHYDTIRSGAVLLLYGMFKKVVIADRAGLIASGIFDNAAGIAENSVMPSGTSIAFAVLMYTLQLYCDFSGCIEIVSGASEMFGIKIAK
ncbi:MAG: MBOAT family protein, partial [Clostridium sp.]|nr:MBOAT family protein [Clostridium sp.]